MKNKIQGAKDFVRSHSTGIKIASGAVLGAGVTYLAMTSPLASTVLTLTQEQAQALIDNPEGCHVAYESVLLPDLKLIVTA